MNSANLLHLGPLYPTDIAIEAIRQLNDPALFISLDVQGYVRFRKHNVMYPAVSKYLPEALAVSKIIKADYSELDVILETYDMTLAELMQCYNIQECLVRENSEKVFVTIRRGDATM